MMLPKTRTIGMGYTACMKYALFWRVLFHQNNGNNINGTAGLLANGSHSYIYCISDYAMAWESSTKSHVQYSNLIKFSVVDLSDRWMETDGVVRHSLTCLHRHYHRSDHPGLWSAFVGVLLVARVWHQATHKNKVGAK